MRKISFEVNLPVSIFKEGDFFVAYSPVLDLSTSGKTYEEVRKRFSEVVRIFFEETSKKGTLEDVLLELGWKRAKKQWLPPPIISHQPERIKISLTA